MKKILFIAFAVISLALPSCIYNDEKPNPILPKFTTLEPQDISYKSVVLRGLVGTEKDYDDSETNTYRQSIKVKFIISDNARFDPEGWISETNVGNADLGKVFTSTFFGLEADKTYYYKMVYGEDSQSIEDVDFLWNVVSFKTPDHTVMKVGNAKLAGTNTYTNSYNCNIVLTSGTMSGKKEEYLKCEGYNGFVNPEILVKASGVKGTIYSFVGYSKDYGFVGYDLNKPSSASSPRVVDTETIYFERINPYWGLYVGCSDNFETTQELYPTMAEIKIILNSSKLGAVNQVFLKDLTKSNKLFYSGWLNLSTGKWVKNEESINSNYLTVVEDSEKTGNYRAFNFYMPPLEFDNNELMFSSSAGNLILPSGSWEAGKQYTYTIRD